ncbi:MAG TPA: PAS domain S-box protein [Opitutaceae bacterium]
MAVDMRSRNAAPNWNGSKSQEGIRIILIWIVRLRWPRPVGPALIRERPPAMDLPMPPADPPSSRPDPSTLREPDDASIVAGGGGQAGGGSEQRLAMLFRHAPYGLALSEASEGRYLDVNDSYCRLLGVNREDLIGRTSVEAGLWHDPEERLRILARIRSDGRVRDCEIRGFNRQGQPLICLVSADVVQIEGRACIVSSLRDVTEQRRTEQALRESEALYRTLVEYSPEGIVLHRDGKIEFVNRAALELIRAAHPGDLVGRNPLDLVHPDMRALVAERLRSLADGSFVTPAMRLQLQRFDGTAVMAETISVAVTLGGERGVLSLLRDLTPRLEAEEALRRSEERFSKAFRLSPDAICLGRLDDGVLIDVNEGFVELSGYHRDEVIGRSSRDLNLWPDLTVRETLLARLHRDGIVRDVEVPFRTKSGALRSCWIAAEVAEIGGQRCFIATARDLSRRQQADAALRESEERYRIVVEQTGQLVYEREIGSGRIKWAGACEQILGLTAREMMRIDAPAWEGLLHPDDRLRAVALLEDSLRSAAPYRARYRFQRKDGAYVIIEDKGIVLRDPSGAATRMLGTMADVTEHERLEAGLRHSQKMESIGLLAGGVAHDFNNVLTVIQGHASLLSIDGQLPAKVQTALAQIGQAAEFAAGLTRQLLAFSRRQVLQPGPLQLDEVVESMSRLLRRTLGENIQLGVVVEPGTPVVEADRSMLEQVLLNLAVNSRDAMPKGGHLAIRVRPADPAVAARQRPPGAAAGPFACIEVADTGAGIAPAVLPRIFDPFFTTKPAGKGTGLGLATVYGIVEQHHGWVDVESTVGHGALFRVWLPALSPAPAAPAPAPAVPPPAPVPAPVAERRHILLVEDEEAVRTLVHAILVRRGFQVTALASGAAALSWWNRTSPAVDLLLTDVIMPEGVSGRDLADRLRVYQPRLPVIFMSGYSADVLGHVDPAKGESFLQKPFPFEVLIETVREALAAAKS